ncbi:ABC transporter ATP-binding protein [Pseudomonas sp. MWU12-2534b]|nr:ABC transporter ATP-binding protein [Pseudomonas sp. MWU12-2534b]
MISLVRELIRLMLPEQRKKLLILQLFVVLMAMAEVIGIAAIGPFMAMVGNIELIESNTLINSIYIETGLSNPIDFLFFVGVAVLVFLAISAMVSTYTIWKLSYFAAKTGAEIGDSLYAYYLSRDFLFHSDTSSAQLTKQIATEVNRITDHLLQPLVQINARIIAAAFIALAIFFYNPFISIVGLIVFLFAYGLLFYIVRGKLARNGMLISKVSKERFSLMNEGFGAIKDVQLLGREKSFINKFKVSGKAFATAYGSSNGLYNMPRYFMEFVIYSGMVGLILVLLKMYKGDLSAILPVLAVFGLAAFKLLPSFQQIYSGLAQIKSNISAFDSIKKDLLSARVSVGNKTLNPQDIVIEGYVELKDVYFKYPSKNSSTLCGISLKFPVNSVVGIVGPSGSGKSTLIDMLLGLISPDEGEFCVGGKCIEKNNIRSWQNLLGYVPQSIFLTEGTIVENIAFGVEEDSIDFKKVEKALKLASLDQWVENLPDGYLTKVGERGVQISGGQRQRLGIARALYNDADFLFFDEATSALDGVTEKMIMEAIDGFSSKKTIVMIAHRLNTVKNCDFIFMIDRGKLVDQGTYEYLLANNPYFKSMANDL